MWRDGAIVLLLMVLPMARAPPPARVSLDYPSSEEMDSLPAIIPRRKASKPTGSRHHSLCDTIDHAIPKSIEDGHFILEDHFDQDGEGDSLVPISVPPPNGFISSFPKLRPSILHVPRMKVPKLRALDKPLLAPKVGKHFSAYRADEEESSAERMERVKIAIEKMLHLVKLLDKFDRYLSDRTRIIIDKVSKTLAD